MSAPPPRDQLHAAYRSLAESFVAGPGEEQLYAASLLARDFVAAGLGPQDLCQLHASLQEEALAHLAPRGAVDGVRRLTTLLLEVMVVYGETHQQVREVLATLQRKYDELEQVRRDLETSQAELRARTAQLVQTGKLTALGELSAGLVHEINQPLNAMKLILDDVLRDSRKGRLEVAALEAGLAEVIGLVRKTADIVDHLRVYTRRTAGSRCDRFDVCEPLTGVFKVLGEQLRIRGILVVQELGVGLEVVGDPVRLEQVFMNLIINARDALERTPPACERRIAIRTFELPAAEAGAWVVVEVADTGCGIPAELQARVFESFFTTKPAGEGTGLGLSVSRQLVEEHGGSIALARSGSSGTVFRVTLPAAARPPAGAAPGATRV